MANVALVGCAHIHTPGFIKRLLANANVSTVAVWDHDPGRAANCAAALGATVAPDLDAVWQDKRLDGVIICSETVRHEELVMGAVRAKLNMFVEKPLGLHAADAQRLAGAIEQAGVVFQTGYFQRGVPAHQFIREHIRAGTFGRISRVRISNGHSGVMRDLFTPDWLWMTDPAQAGVGAFGDMGAHALDLMLWMLGDVASVTASVQVVTGRYGPHCDETGEGMLLFESGTIGTIAAGWVDLADPVTLEISGTEAQAVVRNRSEVFLTSPRLGADGQSPWTDLPAAWPHAFELFLQALLGEDVPLVSPREAAYRSEVMQAMYRAGGSRTWVPLERQRRQ